MPPKHLWEHQPHALAVAFVFHGKGIGIGVATSIGVSLGDSTLGVLLSAPFGFISRVVPTPTSIVSVVAIIRAVVAL